MSAGNAVEVTAVATAESVASFYTRTEAELSEAITALTTAVTNYDLIKAAQLPDEIKSAVLSTQRQTIHSRAVAVSAVTNRLYRGLSDPASENGSTGAKRGRPKKSE